MHASHKSLALLGLGFAAGVLGMLAMGLTRGPSAPTPIATDSYAPAIARAAPAVVQVLAARGALADPRSPPAGAAGLSLGSGVIITPDGLILTARHVVAGAEGVMIGLADGRRLAASVVGSDPANDLALLRIAAAGLTAIAPGDPRALATGDVVLALGHPFGLGQRARIGIIATTGRTRLGLTASDDLLWTDAAINPGDSGGALIDTAGRLIGISLAGISNSGRAEGVGLAVPVDLALVITGRLVTAEHAGGWLGIDTQALTPALAQRFGLRAPHGVFVAVVAADGPAEAAGIRAGDVIASIDDVPLASPLALQERLGNDAPGAQLRLALWRGSERLEALITVGRPPVPAIQQAASTHPGHPWQTRLAPPPPGCGSERRGDC